jgi:phospholipid-translocating ATPase
MFRTDGVLDDDVLMAIPELYSYGRKGHWFGTKIFLLYMFEALYQVCPVLWLKLGTCKLMEAIVRRRLLLHPVRVRHYHFADGRVRRVHLRDVDADGARRRDGGRSARWPEHEGVDVVGLLRGCARHLPCLDLDGQSSSLICIPLQRLTGRSQAVYSAVSPGWIVTFVYGDNHFLFLSAYFYLTIFLTIILALAPRYIAKALKFGFYPDDLDILRYNRKMNPGRDIGRDAYTGGRLAELKHSASRASHASGADVGRPSMDARLASRTDMSTGMRSVHRGFDFITEEDGVAMRRIQTNLSERRVGGGTSPRKRSTTLLRSLKQSLRRKRSNTTASN